jgi:hypothetical protein
MGKAAGSPVYRQHRLKLKRASDPRQERILATKALEADPAETDARVEANIKKEERARDGAKAMMEYLASGQEIRERMAQLRALRLAKEMETKTAAAKQPEAKKAETKKPGSRKPGKKAVNA